jgi:hypothetical protein
LRSPVLAFDPLPSPVLAFDPLPSPRTGIRSLAVARTGIRSLAVARTGIRSLAVAPDWHSIPCRRPGLAHLSTILLHRGHPMRPKRGAPISPPYAIH